LSIRDARPAAAATAYLTPTPGRPGCPAERLPSIVVCTYDVTNLPGPMLLKAGLECHPLTFRRDCLRHNEHHLPAERFLEELSAIRER
jgi:hypothetical protein